MELQEGRYTVETFARERGLTRQSALNLLSRLKKQGYASVSGGGRQKRLYAISTRRRQRTNGFYDLVNRFSPEKLVPRFMHVVVGRYTVEHAIIDGITIGDARTLHATMHLFRHVTSWKRLFDLARKHHVVRDVQRLYAEARKTTRCKTVPKRYLR